MTPTDQKWYDGGRNILWKEKNETVVACGIGWGHWLDGPIWLKRPDTPSSSRLEISDRVRFTKSFSIF
jgi:hypothetical protein